MNPKEEHMLKAIKANAAVKEVQHVEELDLEKLSMKELKSVAKKQGLSDYSKLGKDDLITVIEGL